jgi:hypothetical protein
MRARRWSARRPPHIECRRPAPADRRRPERVATLRTSPAENITEAAGKRWRHGGWSVFATDQCKQNLFPSSRFDRAQVLPFIIETSPERKKPVMTAA